MLALFALIDRLAIGIYIVLGVLGFWHLSRFLRATAEFRATSFELEKSLFRVNQVNAITTIVILGQVALLVLGVQQSALPFLQQQEDFAAIPVAAVEDSVFATRTPPPFVQSGLDGIEPVPLPGDNDSPILQLSPTFTPTPVGTIVPNAPPSEGCEDERATLQIPANGMRVFQPIAVVGTAFAENFSEAKIEIQGPELDTYGVVGGTFQQARERSAFSQFSPAAYPDGLYQFRLMVFDLSGNPVASCMVNIYISAPPVTPTPTVTPPPA